MFETTVVELEKANVALRCKFDAAQKAVSKLQGHLDKAEFLKKSVTCPN